MDEISNQISVKSEIGFVDKKIGIESFYIENVQVRGRL